jgi:hypothetical protein
MVTLEQVKVLESKVSKALGFISQLSQENALLKGQLEKDKTRIDELEMLVERFKEEQGKIEESIVATLDQLAQFEAGHEARAEAPTEEAAVEEAPVLEAPAEEALPLEAETAPEMSLADADEPDETALPDGLLQMDSEAPETNESAELDIF